jgi:hypothetical protein
VNVLDLHGIKHADVPRLVDQFIWEQMNANTKEIEIITGISQVMKEIVINNLKDYEMTYEESWNNPGKILVSLV